MVSVFQMVKASRLWRISRRLQPSGEILNCNKNCRRLKKGHNSNFCLNSTVVTAQCTFHNAVRGTVAVTTWMILQRSNSLREFVSTFGVVLPLYNKLLGISDGSICFTIQAENSAALDALWKQYQNGTLRDKLQEFLVTDEIKRLSGGEEVTLEVHIDEQDYHSACFDLMTTETRGNSNWLEKMYPQDLHMSEWGVIRKVMDKSPEGTHPTVKKTEQEQKKYIKWRIT